MYLENERKLKRSLNYIRKYSQQYFNMPIKCWRDNRIVSSLMLGTNYLRFVDDIVLIADNLKEANDMLTELVQVLKSVGLEMNYC